MHRDEDRWGPLPSRLLVAAAAACLVGCSPTTSRSDEAPSSAVTAGPADAPEPLANPLTATGNEVSVWRQDVSAAPTSQRSDEFVSELVDQVEDRYGGVAAFNVHQFGMSSWTAPWWVDREDVQFNDCQDRGYVPDGLYDGMEHFVDVPIPPHAVPAAGADGHLIIYSPSSDQLWEFWKAERDSGGWSACWGGRLDGVSRSDGRFDGFSGAGAAGVAISAGALRWEEVLSGNVEHTLSLAIPDVARDELSWPASRTDGRDDDAGAIPMGQRFRLDADVDLDALDLHPIAEAVARAAQRYGFMVTDSAGAVAVAAEVGESAQVPPGVQAPWPVLLDGTPSYAVMEGFPWRELEALPKDWGEPGPR
ncbi:hypothetical protein [uncultured Pseudokineococcus sp.]|uniref:hypothetical protein n=1 Tax=uncultured Pseudokineococcus sp. TaxID=1642928 RepID=UPI00260302F8|nr:hypothetical protein [uncultured Pseudokineococcus sp.]